jgi:hypothetical protein
MAAISEETCPICLESMADAFITMCNHRFHAICLDTHILNSTNAKCPLCNKVLYDDSSSSESSSESDEPLLDELSALLNKAIDLIDLMISKLDMIVNTADLHISHLLTQSAESENLALIWYFSKIRAEVAPMETVNMLEQFVSIDYIARTWPNPNLDKNKLIAVKAVLNSFSNNRILITNKLFTYSRTFH